MKPHRVQLSRKLGRRLPTGAKNVARPSRWGNPFVVGQRPVRDAASAVDWHAWWLSVHPEAVRAAKRELAGRILACWCPLYYPDGTRYPCHADNWLMVANDMTMEEIIANEKEAGYGT